MPCSYFRITPHGRTDGLLLEEQLDMLFHLGQLVSEGSVTLETGLGPSIREGGPPSGSRVRLDTELVLPIIQGPVDITTREDLRVLPISDIRDIVKGRVRDALTQTSWVRVTPASGPYTREDRGGCPRTNPVGKLRKMRFGDGSEVRASRLVDLQGPRHIVLGVPERVAGRPDFIGVRTDDALLRAAQASGVTYLEAGYDVGTELLVSGHSPVTDRVVGTTITRPPEAEKWVGVEERVRYSIGKIGLYKTGERIDKAMGLIRSEQVDLARLASLAGVTMDAVLLAIDHGVTALRVNADTGCYCPNRQTDPRGVRLGTLTLGDVRGRTVFTKGRMLTTRDGRSLSCDSTHSIWHLEEGAGGMFPNIPADSQLLGGRTATGNTNNGPRGKGKPGTAGPSPEPVTSAPGSRLTPDDILAMTDKWVPGVDKLRGLLPYTKDDRCGEGCAAQGCALLCSCATLRFGELEA